MTVKRLNVGICGTNCYIVENENYLLIIDPGSDFNKIAENLKRSPTHVVLTHLHFDHVGAAFLLHEKYPDAKFYWGEFEKSDISEIRNTASLFLGSAAEQWDCRLPKPEQILSDGDRLLDFTIMHTPGHTMGSICLYNKEEKILFSGDTLFYHSYGRTDLGGSDELLAASLKKIMALDKNTIVYPGHGFSTSIEEESI